MSEERRVPCQGEGAWWCYPGHSVWRENPPPKMPGSITWTEHVEIWKKYAEQYGEDQSAERMAQRGGFGFYEAQTLLGRPLQTWRPSENR